MADRLVISFNNLRHPLIEGVDFGDSLYSFSFDPEVNVLEAKVLHSMVVLRDPGMPSFSGKFDCYTAVQPTTLDLAKRIVQVPAGDGAEGSPVYMGVAVIGQLGESMQVDDYKKFEIPFSFDGWAYRGKVLRNRILDAAGAANPQTATGNGNWIVLGTPAAGQVLASAAHLVAFTGSEIVLTVQSDDSGRASPTTRITHTFTGTDAAAIGAKFATVAAPASTDTDYRVVVSGTFTSASFIIGAALR